MVHFPFDETAKGLFSGRHQSHLQPATAFVACLRAKDESTYQHSVNVARYAMDISRRFQLSEERQRLLYVAACLHDVGKIGVDDGILRKPGTLTKEEYACIQRHPAIGEALVLSLPCLAEAAKIIRHHHEKYDGSGYPDRLYGNEIPLECRIIAVADAYDAMTTRAHSGTTKNKQQTLAEIARCAGKQFDMEVAESFLEMMDL